MDLLSINPNSSGVGEHSESHEPTPPLRCDGNVSHPPELPIEIFKLVDDKWFKVPTKTFKKRIINTTIFSNLMVKSGGFYYCGNDDVWNKLEDKNELRLWMHDLFLNSMKDNEYTEGWLQKKVHQVIAI